MGTFTFKWAHPDASDVYVTGTFDKWSKSEKLDKKGDHFEKVVTLPDASEKIYYKFVVDGNWCIDPTAPQEHDPQNNMNNFLTPEQIAKHTPATAGILSSIGPTSTTHDLAKDVPLEKSATDVPGAFPVTPATEPASFSVNPIPATAGAGNPINLPAGDKVPDPSTLTSNTVSSGVHDDTSLIKKADPQQTFSVNPIPATAGAGNPVNIPAGAGVPAQSQVTGNTIQSTVTTDKESYEKPDAPPTFLPLVGTSLAGEKEKDSGAFDLPPISKNMIPESSLPMGTSGVGTFDASPLIQSVGPQSTTAQLASQVPLEPKADEVPEIVKESQKEAGFGPEASAVPEEVREKSAVESELLKEVPEAPITADGTTTATKSAGVTAGEVGTAVGGAALAVGGAAAAYAVTAKDKVAEGINQTSATNHAQTVSSYATDAKDKVAAVAGLGSASAPKATSAVPEVVKESIAKSGQSPEAAAYSEPLSEKKAVEKELLTEVKPETSTGQPAPKIEQKAAALSPPAATPEPNSRDISPTTVPGSHKPTATTGVATTNVEKSSNAPTTPAKTAPAASSSTKDSPATSAAGSSAAEVKKNKRRSFFGRIKDKLTDKKN